MPTRQVCQCARGVRLFHWPSRPTPISASTVKSPSFVSARRPPIAAELTARSSNQYNAHNRKFSSAPARRQRTPLPRDPYQEYQQIVRQRMEEARRSGQRPPSSIDRMITIASHRNTRSFVVAAALAAAVFYWWNLETVPVSGRRRFNCYPPWMAEKLSDYYFEGTKQAIEQEGGRFLPDRDPRVLLVRRVMRRLVPVSGLTDTPWDVHVVDRPGILNAMVLPGGHVFVFADLLKVTRNEAGLATVLGHEIAHTLAQHQTERMSGSVGPTILSLSLLVSMPFVFLLFGGHRILSALFETPMGRLQETEADYIGLMLMAEACYDPREAISFWQRMEYQEKAMQERMHAVEVPEFLRTHPLTSNRIKKIQQWQPEAMAKREASECTGTAHFADLFRLAMARGRVITEDATVSDAGDA